MNRSIKLAAVILSAVIIQGCSSLGVGESSYSCNGMPDGVKCMGTKDVYYNTNNGNVPAPTTKKGEVFVKQGENPVIQSKAMLDDQYNDYIMKRHVATNLPYQPVPIRTPSQTMRIFISPFEDEEGDLLVPGLVYTDIEKRSWVIGAPVAAKSNSLKPLQTIQSTKESEE